MTKTLQKENFKNKKMMEWTRGDRIGHGSFATVNLAIPKTKTYPKLMAVKSCGATLSASLMHEKLILDDLQECPQIISCFGDCFSVENGEKLYNVLLDYASGGSLCDKIQNSYNHKLSEVDVRGYTKSILQGIHFIHSKGYVHCDIKLENILLDQYGIVKIADFGLAKKAGEESGDGNLRGTPMYMSPEMATRGEQDFPADIWALGCAVAEMITGTFAWQCSNMAALVVKIGVGEDAPELPGNLSDEGKDFLEKCFVKDPKERWTAEMLLNHPFVDHLNYEDVFNTVSLRKMTDLPSTSPRCPFELWVSPLSMLDFDFDSIWCGSSGGGSSSISPAKRLSRLVCDRMPEWTMEDEWITVR